MKAHEIWDKGLVIKKESLDRMPNDPTPEEIAAMCKVIQDERESLLVADFENDYYIEEGLCLQDLFAD